MQNILIVTGGSGGHVIPSITIFKHLKKNFLVRIVSDLRGSKFIDKNKYNYEIMDIPNLFLKKYLLPINIFKYFFNILKSFNYLKKNKIIIIIGTGGYMSLPFCLAAFLLKKKIYLIEPNSFLGRSNKIVLNFSNKIICYDNNLENFPKKYNSKKISIDPILNNQIYNLKKNTKFLNSKKKKILIIGGSQGASFFDNYITDAIVNISKKLDIEVIQQISNKEVFSIVEEKYKKADIKYEFFSFIKESNKIYEGVDLAITRGGAGTLSELSFLNIPFISIPLPSAKDNHQYHNSNYYYKKKLCWIIDQNKFDLNELSNLIFEIFENKNDYSRIINYMDKLTKNNTWNTINNRIIEIINEN